MSNKELLATNQKLDLALEAKKRQLLAEEIGNIIVNAIKPSLDLIAEKTATVEELTKAIAGIKMPSVIVPEIKVPTITMPEVKVPEAKVTVNVPKQDPVEVRMPQITIPEIKLPIIKVPKPEVTVNIPKQDMPKEPLPPYDEGEVAYPNAQTEEWTLKNKGVVVATVRIEYSDDQRTKLKSFQIQT